MYDLHGCDSEEAERNSFRRSLLQTCYMSDVVLGSGIDKIGREDDSCGRIRDLEDFSLPLLLSIRL